MVMNRKRAKWLLYSIALLLMCGDASAIVEGTSSAETTLNAVKEVGQKWLNGYPAVTQISPQCCIDSNQFNTVLAQSSVCGAGGLQYGVGGVTCKQFAGGLVSNLNANAPGCDGTPVAWRLEFLPFPNPIPYPLSYYYTINSDPLCDGHAEVLTAVCVPGGGVSLCITEPQSDVTIFCLLPGATTIPDSVIQTLINQFPSMVQCQQKYGFTQGSYSIVQ
jgi:hypothetical protein